MHPTAKVEALKALRSNIFKIIKMLPTGDIVLHRRLHRVLQVAAGKC